MESGYIDYVDYKCRVANYPKEHRGSVTIHTSLKLLLGQGMKENKDSYKIYSLHPI